MAMVLTPFWACFGAFTLLFSRIAGGQTEVLWSVATTFLLTFSSATAIGGLFAGKWLHYTASCLAGYLLLALVLAAGVSQLQAGSFEEIKTYPEMYAAFFLSFFMITGVTGAVRAIASFLHD